MFARKDVLLVSLMVIGACLLSANSVVFGAVCDVPASCTLYDINGTPSPYSLRIAPVNGQWPVKMADGRYEWLYEAVGVLSTSNQLTVLAPVCCPDLTYSVLSGGQVQPPGTGDTSSTFGLGNYQDYVIRMAASPTSTGLPGYSFLTSRLPEFRQTVTMQLKSGKNTYYCRGIAGPHCINDCPVASSVPIDTYEEKMLGMFNVRVTRDRNSWCALVVEYFDPRQFLFDGSPNPNWNMWVTLGPEPASINEQWVVQCGNADGNQRCQECLIFGENSPGCYTYTSGGTTYKIPTGCK